MANQKTKGTKLKKELPKTATKTEPSKNRERKIATKSSSIRWKLPLIHFILGLLSTVIGVILISLTWVKNPPNNTGDNETYLEIYPNYEPNMGYTDEDLKAGLYFDVNIYIRLRPDNSNADMTVSISPHEIHSQNLTLFKPPKFIIIWPGKVILGDFSRDIMSTLYKVQTNDNSTIIETVDNEYPTIDLIWIDAVNTLGLFKKSLTLKLGDFTDINLTRFENELGYQIAIIPSIPQHNIITYSKPEIQDWSKGITVVKRGGGFFNEYEHNISTSDFFLVFESGNAEDQRNFLVIASGIMLGIAGNFFVNTATKLFETKT